MPHYIFTYMNSLSLKFSNYVNSQDDLFVLSRRNTRANSSSWILWILSFRLSMQMIILGDTPINTTCVVASQMRCVPTHDLLVKMVVTVRPYYNPTKSKQRSYPPFCEGKSQPRLNLVGSVPQTHWNPSTRERGEELSQ